MQCKRLVKWLPKGRGKRSGMARIFTKEGGRHEVERERQGRRDGVGHW